MSEAIAIKGRNVLGLIRPMWRMRQGDFAPLERAIRRYDDISRVRVGPYRIVFLQHPDHIEELLVKNYRQFKKDDGMEYLRMILGDGLLTSEGAFHLRQRRMIQPAFHKERIAQYAASMAEYAEECAASWAPGARIDVNQEMMKVTLRIIGKTLFNADVARDAATVAHALEVIFEYTDLLSIDWVRKLVRALPLPLNKRLDRARDDLDQTIYRIINGRRAADVDHGDLLSMLLRAQDEEDGKGMSDKQIRDECLTLFLAGHETTAIALTWTLYLLSQNPLIQERLHAELERVLEGRSPSFEDVPRLDYARRVFTESMRLYPPAYGFGREAIEDATIGGCAIRKGDMVIVSPYLTQRDPRFFPEPHAFDPDRWLPDRAEGLHKFAYFPFGGGVRKCIGESFAWMEGILLLSVFAQRWRFQHDPSHRITLEPRITLRPKGGMPMIPTRWD